MSSIRNKVIYLRDKAKLDDVLKQVPEGLNPIIFIESSKEIYTCGTFFATEREVQGVDVSVTDENGKVSININGNKATFATSGSGLSVSKQGNNIVFKSSALTAGDIKTDDVLYWDYDNKTLKHQDSGVKAGGYGQSGSASGASTFTVPYVTVNASGHVTAAKDVAITIRDYVGQKAPTAENADRPILGATSTSTSEETGEVVKTNGLTYNDATGDLKVKGGVSILGGSVYVDSVTGDLHVTGNIHGTLVGSATGTAVPKVHLSDQPVYGGASTALYGHVKLQDEFTRDNKGVIVRPNASSSNISNSAENVEAIAASPRMVYDAMEEVKQYVTSVAGGVVVTAAGKEVKSLNLTGDFNVDDSGNMSIAWFTIN